MRKTAFILLLIVGTVLLMTHSASAGQKKTVIPIFNPPTTPPQPFTSAT